MSINSSSHSIHSVLLECKQSIASNIISTTYTFTNILFLLPLYVLILYMGFHRWRRQSMSHSDFFTYNMMLVEICGILGSFFYTVSIFVNIEMLLMFGVCLFGVIFPGQAMFHVLTCVERYLAVVHPIIYMKQREKSGVRIRNVSSGCVWLLCFGWVVLTKFHYPGFPTIPLFPFMGVCIFIVLFCCLSVLHVLTRPGPGEVGGNKGQVDQSKQRAFHMISMIMGALLLRFVGLLVCFSFEFMLLFDLKDLCTLMDVGIWLTVPSSLVLPLLFLHRAEKLACCRQRTQTE